MASTIASISAAAAAAASLDDAERRRRRITLACAYCRYRKIRCDGAPVCKNCAEGSWRCEYVKVSAEENRAARERKAQTKARQLKTAPAESSAAAASSQRARKSTSTKRQTTKTRADSSDDALSPVDPGFGWPTPASSCASPYSVYTPSVLCSSQPPSLTSTASPSPASSTFFEHATLYPPPPLSIVGATSYEQLNAMHDAVWAPPSPPSDVYEEAQGRCSSTWGRTDMSAFKMSFDGTDAHAEHQHLPAYYVDGREPGSHYHHPHHYSDVSAGHPPVIMPINHSAYPLTPLPTPTEQLVFGHHHLIALHEAEPEYPHHHNHHNLHDAQALPLSRSLESSRQSSVDESAPYSPHSSIHGHDDYVSHMPRHAQPPAGWEDVHLVPAVPEPCSYDGSVGSPVTLVASDGYHHPSPTADYERLIPVSPMLAAPSALHAVGGHDVDSLPICSPADVFSDAGIVTLH